MASAEVKVETSGFVDNWQSGKSLAECNRHMLTSEDSCDVSFRVGHSEKIVRAHCYILMSRSCVFHAMLRGPMAEKDDIRIPDVEEEIFAEMLKYLYTNDSTLTPDNVMGLFYLSKKYAVGGLERLCLCYLDKSISPDNACVMLEQAHGFDEKELQDKALKVILQNGEVSVTSPGFQDLCHPCLDKVVKSDHLKAKAGAVFKAVLTWTKAECKRQGREVTPEKQRHVLGETVFVVPFTELGAGDFAKLVVPSGILSAEECTKLFCFFSLSDGDAAPFTIKSKRVGDMQTHKEIYLNQKIGYMEQQDLSSKLNTCVLLKPTKSIRLIGFKTFGSRTCSNYKFKVKIEVEVEGPCGSIFVEKISTTLVGNPSLTDRSEIELHLPEAHLLQAGMRHWVLVETLEGESTVYGVDLKSTVIISNCMINVSYPSVDQCRKGLISKLILQEV